MFGPNSGIRVIGHRGAAGAAPENTIEGIEHGIASGADAIEVDVHVATCGTLVTIHDDTLERTTDGSGPVEQLDLGPRTQFSLSQNRNSHPDTRCRRRGCWQSPYDHRDQIAWGGPRSRRMAEPAQRSRPISRGRFRPCFRCPGGYRRPLAMRDPERSQTVCPPRKTGALREHSV